MGGLVFPEDGRDFLDAEVVEENKVVTPENVSQTEGKNADSGCLFFGTRR